MSAFGEQVLNVDGAYTGLSISAITLDHVKYPYAGGIDRQKLGNLIFSDKAARKKLNAATHTPVFMELFRQIFMCWLCCRDIVVYCLFSCLLEPF